MSDQSETPIVQIFESRGEQVAFVAGAAAMLVLTLIWSSQEAGWILFVMVLVAAILMRLGYVE